jgi:hypothetical protein
MTSPDTRDRLAQVGALLLRQTEAGAIEWRTTDDEEAFLYSGSKGSVLSRRYLDRQEDSWYYTLSVLNSRGTEVDKLEEDWTRDAANKPLHQEHNTMLEALWNAARRSALKIDEVLDELMEEIKDPKKFASGQAFDDEPPF